MRYNRRRFIGLLSAVGGALVARTRALRASQPRVEAQPTVFASHPEGQRTLVRFLITGTGAPAGRLRLFDEGRRIVGTAGVISVGEDRLYGELWVPLSRPLRVVSELEAPGISPVRTVHELTPQPRWTLHWFTVCRPDDLIEHLISLPPLGRAVEASLFRAHAVGVNPMPRGENFELLDHLSFLKLASDGAGRALQMGIPVSPLALRTAVEQCPPTLPLLLVGSGISHLAVVNQAEASPHWLEGPDGSRMLVVPLLPGADPRELGFALSANEMSQRVERWLAGAPQASSSTSPVALVVGTRPEDANAASIRAVEQWNSRYAYPRIIVGGIEQLPQAVERQSRTALRVERPRCVPDNGQVPGAAAIGEVVNQRAKERRRRGETVIASLASALGGGSPALETLAEKLSFPLPGTLVFNPAPVTRTEVVRLTDGRERLITDIPRLGYVYVPHLPDAGQTEWTAVPDAPDRLSLQNQSLRVRLDQSNGAIASLVSSSDGTEWVRGGVSGLNGIPAARLERVTRLEMPGVGSRVNTTRWAPGRGTVRTSVTLYQSLPWVEIENSAEAVGGDPVPYHFSFSLDQPQVEWEIPLGRAAARPPLERLTPLRWIRLSGPSGQALVSSMDTPFAAVSESGELICLGPRGTARFRIAVAPPGGRPLDDEPWRFGWSTEPIFTAPAEGRGGTALPGSGSLLETREPGIAVLGLEPEPGGSLVVYVQELLELERRFVLGFGLLRFGQARLIDFMGRERESLQVDEDLGAIVPLAARGVAAVRLVDVTLAYT